MLTKAEYCTVALLSIRKLEQGLSERKRSILYGELLFCILTAASLRNDRLAATVSPSGLIVLDSLRDHLVHDGTEIDGIESPSRKVISTSIQSYKAGEESKSCLTTDENGCW